MPDAEQKLQTAAAADRTHTPGNFTAKLVFVMVGLAVLAFGCAFIYEPMVRMLFGEQQEAKGCHDCPNRTR